MKMDNRKRNTTSLTGQNMALESRGTKMDKFLKKEHFKFGLQDGSVNNGMQMETCAQKHNLSKA